MTPSTHHHGTQSHLDVLASANLVDEDTSALNDQVNVHLPPGQLHRVAAGHNLDRLSINRDVAVIDDLHVRTEGAEGGIVLQEVAGLLDTAAVVDGNHVQQRVLAAVPAAQEVAANATEAVDGDADLLLRAHVNDGAGGLQLG